MYGTVWLDSAAAEGMTRTNNDFGRGHEALVTGHTSKDGKVSRVFGTFHSLPIKLQESLVVAAKRNVKNVKKSFDVALAKQKAARLRKEEIAHQKKIELTQEEYIIAIDLWEQYYLPRCWKTKFITN
jgi:hypothetical protein